MNKELLAEIARLQHRLRVLDLTANDFTTMRESRLSSPIDGKVLVDFQRLFYQGKKAKAPDAGPVSAVTAVR